MAYGNWGAYVYKNGERQRNREDNTPYKEDELESGYWQVFGRSDEINPHHASFGSGKFRICAYKSSPYLFWEGSQIDDSPYQKGENAGTEKWNWYDSEGIEGDIRGYKFKAWPSDSPEAVNIELIEPDGTKWNGKSGYCMGAGHDD